jgi:hypothetical protein
MGDKEFSNESLKEEWVRKIKAKHPKAEPIANFLAGQPGRQLVPVPLSYLAGEDALQCAAFDSQLRPSLQVGIHLLALSDVPSTSDESDEKRRRGNVLAANMLAYSFARRKGAAWATAAGSDFAKTPRQSCVELLDAAWRLLVLEDGDLKHCWPQMEEPNILVAKARERKDKKPTVNQENLNRLFGISEERHGIRLGRWRPNPNIISALNERETEAARLISLYFLRVVYGALQVPPTSEADHAHSSRKVFLESIRVLLRKTPARCSAKPLAESVRAGIEDFIRAPYDDFIKSLSSADRTTLPEPFLPHKQTRSVHVDSIAKLVGETHAAEFDRVRTLALAVTAKLLDPISWIDPDLAEVKWVAVLRLLSGFANPGRSDSILPAHLEGGSATLYAFLRNALQMRERYQDAYKTVVRHVRDRSFVAKCGVACLTRGRGI